MNNDLPIQPNAQCNGRNTPVPSENTNMVFFTALSKAYGNYCQWTLTDEERRQWSDTDSPLLDMLRVFCCGLFVEAHGHSWERSDLAEGVLIYCTSGKGNYRQGGQQWEIKAGDLLYCPPNSHHQYWADAAQPWTIYWMHLSGSMLPQYEKHLGLVDSSPVRHIGTHDTIIAEFTHLIARHPLAMSSADWFRIQTNAIAVLGRIAELPHNIADIATAYGPVQKAIALIDASLDQIFDLQRFSAEAGLGRRHFTRQFIRVTGMSPGEWFSRRKMQRACSMITMPNIQIKEIAHRLGYEDALYFNRVFKRVIGIPPGKYRYKMTLENE